MKTIVIIGGGFFGCCAALSLVNEEFCYRGLNADAVRVILLEAQDDLLLGASMMNQCRVHRGYHYPGAPETLEQLHGSYDEFCSVFSKAMLCSKTAQNQSNEFTHYYCIVDKSRISCEEYATFMEVNGLWHEKKNLPAAIQLNKERVVGSWMVEEPIFDVAEARSIIWRHLKEVPQLDVKLNSRVCRVERHGEKFSLNCENGDEIENVDCIINASYSQMNHVKSLIGIPLRPNIIYELCEEFVVQVDETWPECYGVAFFDGPFFGVMPFGKQDQYIIYDVVSSRLLTHKGDYADFKTSHVEELKRPEACMERYEKWQAKASGILPHVKHFRYIKSFFCVRVLSSNRERISVIERNDERVWTIFSAKVDSCVHVAKQLRVMVEESLFPGGSVSIFGASGWAGKIHSRIFRDLGCYVIAEPRIVSKGDSHHQLSPIVSICTPTDTHLVYLEAALHRGARCVLVEKGLCNYEQEKEATQLIRLANEKNVQVFVTYQFSSVVEPYKQVHELVKGGNGSETIPSSFYFRWTTRPGYPVGSASWFWELLACHGFSILGRMIPALMQESPQSIENFIVGSRFKSSFTLGLVKCVIDVGPPLENGTVERIFGFDGVRVAYAFDDGKTWLTSVGGKGEKVGVTDVFANYLEDFLQVETLTMKAASLFSMQDALWVLRCCKEVQEEVP